MYIHMCVIGGTSMNMTTLSIVIGFMQVIGVLDVVLAVKMPAFYQVCICVFRIMRVKHES